ncbi:hypothetical protein LRR81_04125 [Metabacillus sp. GX 13764]|uniref:hypothetical protein n=1 Tax=Metabacillus kandeliae TaxID=2900151 RepID=UPI001E2E8620|nr:hypothetical protein [Metabacillus kandeliae]MCD7033407.1 hypothetical protein [Metabacillus kandeliae]
MMKKLADRLEIEQLLLEIIEELDILEEKLVQNISRTEEDEIIRIQADICQISNALSDAEDLPQLPQFTAGCRKTVLPLSY